MTIRSRLLALIVFTLLPILLFGIGGGYLLVEKERSTFEHGALDRVQALMTAVDAELSSSITPLQLLAQSPNIDRGDLQAFRGEAQRALISQRPDWANVVLSDAVTGQEVMNLLVPAGDPFPKEPDSQGVISVAQNQRPHVVAMTPEPLLKRHIFMVRVPVVRDSRSKFVLSAAVEPETIGRLLDRQSVPPGWAVAVVDSNFRFVARRPLGRGPTDDYASASLRETLTRADSGWSRGRLADGSEIYRAILRSSFSGWSTSLAIPERVVNQGVVQATWLFVLGLALALSVAAWIAVLLSRRITEPISALVLAAPAIGRGDASAVPPPAPLKEARALADALHKSAIEIREREERQRQAEEALRAADRAKDEFLAMLGHELRNPLATLSNAAALMKLGREQPQVLDSVQDMVSRQVQHMTHLVDDLLDVGRVTGGKIRLERQPLDLSKLAADVVRTWKSAGRFAHHEVTTGLDPVWVSADTARAEQIISNLLDNALKYTPAGGKLRLEVRPEGSWAVLKVSDTGEGLPAELIGRVFDLFVQGERALARERGGLGIGLTMVKRLVELHGGEITAQSDGPGKGATFTVKLPMIEHETLEDPAAGAAPTRTARRRILVIEDDADGRESLVAILRMSGHEIESAANGLEGIERATATNPELALIDIGLPDMDGYDVVREIRRRLPHTRSIALSGYGTQEDRRRALEAGFDEHLTKPVDIGRLESVIGIVLG
jgi:signal transduction histidine kinase/CheY-like chemotaxis protein